MKRSNRTRERAAQQEISQVSHHQDATATVPHTNNGMMSQTDNDDDFGSSARDLVVGDNHHFSASVNSVKEREKRLLCVRDCVCVTEYKKEMKGDIYMSWPSLGRVIQQ